MIPAVFFSVNGGCVRVRFDKCARVHIGIGCQTNRRICYKRRHSLGESALGALHGRLPFLGSVVAIYCVSSFHTKMLAGSASCLESRTESACNPIGAVQ